MEEWLVLVVWAVVSFAVAVSLRLSLTNIFSSIAMGIISGGIFLMSMRQYNVTGCQYNITIYDTIATLILVGTVALWIVWTAYQVFRDNKERRCFYFCRRKKDINVTYDIKQYDDPPVEEGKEPISDVARLLEEGENKL